MLAIIIHSLSRVGGTESVVKLLANNLSYYTKVIIIETEKSSYRKNSNDRFDIVNLASDFRNEKVNMFFSMLKVRSFVKKLAIENVYSTFGNLNLLSLLLLRGRNIIVCDHLCYKQSMTGFFGSLRKKFYKYASYVVSLTNKDFENYINDGCKCVVIENPMDVDKIYPANSSRSGIIAVGRICYQKNYERMLNIFSWLVKKIPSVQLNIFGNGEAEYVDSINELIIKNKLATNVFLHKATEEIGIWYSKSSLLMMTSHYEGLPMVLIEAQANGLPCVALDVDTGPSDVIVNNKVGLLLDPNENDEEIANKIYLYYKSLDADNTHAAVLNSQRFLIEPIIKKWLGILHV